MNRLVNFMLWLAFWYNRTCIFKIDASQDVYLYSTNQSESLECMLIPDKIPSLDELELWRDQTYGDLVMSQRASQKEEVPVWKSVDEHLKDIDLFVNAVENVFPDLHSWSVDEVKFGTSGVLKLHNGTSNANKKKLMFTLDAEHNLVVPIPKFVYRIIRAHCFYSHEFHRTADHNQNYNAVIIIHNDPTIGSDGDRFDCQSCSGWNAIENTYTEAGLTYVCQLAEEMSKILGIEDYDPESKPLDLNFMEYSSCEHWGWTSLTCPRECGDQTGRIYQEYLVLKKSNED